MAWMIPSHFSWSRGRRLSPPSGADPHKSWSWYADVWRTIIGVINGSDVASPDVEDSSEATRKSLFELSNVLNRKRGRRTAERKGQKSNSVCVYDIPSSSKNTPRGDAWNHNLWWDLREEPISVQQLTCFFLETKNFYTDKEQTGKKYTKDSLVWVVCLSCCLWKNNAFDCMGILLAEWNVERMSTQ